MYCIFETNNFFKNIKCKNIYKNIDFAKVVSEVFRRSLHNAESLAYSLPSVFHLELEVGGVGGDLLGYPWNNVGK